MKEAGFACVYLHPMSDCFQKHFFFRGMDIAYLGSRYFQLVHVMLEECRRLGLTMMLYDESGWPSGGVLDRLLRLHPEVRRKYIDRDGNIGYQEVPDLMGGRATDYFIDMVYERYRQELGNEFGKTIRGIFTDEPFWKVTFSDELMSIPPNSIPFPDGIEQELQEVFQLKLSDLLPQLLGGEHASLLDRSEAREIYLECCTRLFARNYTAKLARWCQMNHLDFEGHYDEDDGFFEGNGPHSPLRLLSPMHVPGVDAIWRLIYPEGDRNGHYARFAQAAAIRNRREDAFCECFNVYGYYLTTPVMSWVGNMLLTKGINRLLMMPYLYSDRGLRKICCGTDISPRNPIWHALPALNAFWRWAGNFNTGAWDTNVWVLVRRDIQDSEFGEKVHHMFELLDEKLVEWRLADDDDLNTPCGFRPSILVVPGELSEMEKNRLNLTGLRLVNGFDASALAGLPCLAAEPNTGVRVLRCLRPEGEALLLFNSTNAECCFRLKRSTGFRHELPPPDPVPCEIAPVCERNDAVEIPLPPWGLRILLKERPSQAPAALAPTHRRRVRLDWSLKKLRCLRLSREGATHYEEQTMNVPLRDGDITRVMPAFSGIAEVQSEFVSEQATTAWIVLDEVQYGAEFFCNGKRCGLRAFAPWAFKIRLRQGVNRFKIRISSSGGNEYARCAAEELEPAGWFNDYARIRKSFVRDDTQCGVSPRATLLW